MEPTLSVPTASDGEDVAPHRLICELAQKTQIPAETLAEYRVTAKPDASVPKSIREREPHLPQRLPAVALPLVPLDGNAKPPAYTYRAADEWRTAKGTSVKWHSGRSQIADLHRVIAPGGAPTWERPLAIAEGLTDTLTAHHTILQYGINADVVGAPGVTRATVTAAEAAHRGVACILLLDNDDASRKAAEVAIRAYYARRSPDDGGLIMDVGKLLPQEADITDIGPEALSQLLANAPPVEWEPPPEAPSTTSGGCWEEHTDWWVASNGEPDLLEDAPRSGAAHWHYRNSLGLRVHLNSASADLRYNIRAHRYEMCWGDDRPNDIPAGWCEMTDKRRDVLFDDISLRCSFYTLEKGEDGHSRRYKPAEWRGAARDEAINALTAEVDPFVTDYLEVLPEWDGTRRLATLLHRVFRVDSDTPAELAEWAIASVLGVAVARAFRPNGYRHDETPVLVGPQDCGKSSLWEALCPRSEWYAGNVPLAARIDGDKKYCEAVMGRVIACCGELAGVGKAELADVKRRMTLAVFSYRLPFRRNSEQIVVRHALVGDTNDKECLPNDPTGNRRWVPIGVEPHPGQPPHKTPLEWAHSVIGPERDQLWAEALHRWDSGERPHLPQALKDVAREHAAPFRLTDELAEDWAARKVAACEQRGIKVRLADLASANDVPKDLNDRRIRKALRNIGYVPRNTNGERWWEPELDPSALVRLSAPNPDLSNRPQSEDVRHQQDQNEPPTNANCGDMTTPGTSALGALSRTDGNRNPPPEAAQDDEWDPQRLTAAAREMMNLPSGGHASDTAETPLPEHPTPADKLHGPDARLF